MGQVPLAGFEPAALCLEGIRSATEPQVLPVCRASRLSRSWRLLETPVRFRVRETAHAPLRAHVSRNGLAHGSSVCPPGNPQA